MTRSQERRIQGLEEWRTGGPLGSQVNVRFDSTVPASLKVRELITLIILWSPHLPFAKSRQQNREKAEQHELDSL